MLRKESRMPAGGDQLRERAQVIAARLAASRPVKTICKEKGGKSVAHRWQGQPWESIGYGRAVRRDEGAIGRNSRSSP
jgi:hypothetical protein